MELQLRIKARLSEHQRTLICKRLRKLSFVYKATFAKPNRCTVAYTGGADEERTISYALQNIGYKSERCNG